MSKQPGERTDRDELREVMLAFMDKFEGRRSGPGKTRIHKLVFFGDLYSLHWYGGRLTDANFKAYDYGAFSTDIQNLLEDMIESDDVESFSSNYSRHPQYRNMRKPRLNSDKREIIDEVWQETKNLSDSTLGKFTKGSWLYENTPYDEEMDWEEYKQVVGPATQWREVVDDLNEKDPVNDDAEAVADLL